MAASPGTPENQSAEMNLNRAENMGGRIAAVAEAIKVTSELRASKVQTNRELEDFEQGIFGDRKKLWDEKSEISKTVNQVIKQSLTKDEEHMGQDEITGDQAENIRLGIETFCRNLNSGDFRLVNQQRDEVLRLIERSTAAGASRANEILDAAMELIDSKWRFAQDRELMGRLEGLAQDKITQPIENNLNNVKEATKETRKRDEKNDRADVKGNERHTREIWFTTEWKSVKSKNPGEYDKETASTEFIREEIEADGGVATQTQKFGDSHKFGDGSEEMLEWRFFKHQALDAAVKQNKIPEFIQTSLDQIGRVAKWIDADWNESMGLPTEETMKQCTVGGALAREVWRVLQDNVRAGLTLLENDVTKDIMRCRPDHSLTPKIIESKAKGIFEYAVYPGERNRQEEKFSELQIQVGHSLEAIENRQKKLQKTGEKEQGAVVIKDLTGEKHSFKVDLRSETFNPMFLIKDGKNNFGELEYLAWMARSRLQLLVHTSLNIHEPLHDVGVQGPSMWAYLEGMVALSGKPWVPDVLQIENISRLPGAADFWVLQFWLNQGKDVVVEDVEQLPYYKQTAAEIFKEVVVKAYYAPAKGKSTGVGVWLDHSKPISPTLYKLMVKNLQEGRMIWEETGRPTMVNLWYYTLYATWEATTHFTEYGPEEYKIWLQSHGQDHSNPVAYIQGFSAFFSEKLAAGLALPLLPDLIYSSQGMLSELFPLVKRANGEYELVEGGEELETIPQGELVRTFREEMKKARQQYIFELLPVLEAEIFEQIQLLIQGAEVVSTKMGRKILAGNIFELLAKNIFTNHVTQAWCGTGSFPNEFYKRRIRTMKDGQLVSQTIESMPINIDLVAAFERIDRINEQQGAALILTGVPDEVINARLPQVLFGRRSWDPEGQSLKVIQNLGRLVYGKSPQYAEMLKAIASGATPEEIGGAFSGNKGQAAEQLANAIMLQLYRRYAGVFNAASFYDITLFAWAKEVTGWYEPLGRRLFPKNDYKFLVEPYSADIEVWEEIATWEFKTGPRKGQRIFYHPSFDPRGAAPYDAFFYEGLKASGLTRYNKEGERDAIWESGDIVLTLAADTPIRLKSFEADQRRKRLMYTEIGRFSPAMPIDMSCSMFRYGQVHNKLRALNGFRPGVDYGLVPKRRELNEILKSNFFELIPDQVEEIDGILNGWWPWLKREFTYGALDLMVGQPDPIQKFLEGFKKETGGIVSSTPWGSALNLFMNSWIAPFPQFRATPISLPIGLAVGFTVAPFFMIGSWPVGGIIAGLYAFNVSGRAIQWLFAEGLESALNTIKHRGGFNSLGFYLRKLPGGGKIAEVIEKTPIIGRLTKGFFFRELPDGKKRALQRTPTLLGGPLHSQLVEIGNKPSVFWDVMQEKSLAGRRERVAQLAGAIMEDKITSN